MAILDSKSLEVKFTKAAGIFIFVVLTFLVSWTYFVVMVIVCFQLIGSIAAKFIIGVILNVLVLLMEASHFRSSFTSKRMFPPEEFSLARNRGTSLLPDQPSEISLDSIDLKEDIVNEHNLEQRTVDGEIRICHICNIVKPDRTHHCSICGRCILKMDHHCPWINNCTGYYNYKFFVLYLFYVILYCIFCSSISVTLIFRDFSKMQMHFVILSSDAVKVQLMILGIIAVCFLFAVGGLFFYHLKLIFSNLTTLESTRSPCFTNGTSKKAYDEGIRKNWCSVFGKKWYLWFIPIFTTEGDGIHFERKDIITEI